MIVEEMFCRTQDSAQGRNLGLRLHCVIFPIFPFHIYIMLNDVVSIKITYMLVRFGSVNFFFPKPNSEFTLLGFLLLKPNQTFFKMKTKPIRPVWVSWDRFGRFIGFNLHSYIQ